jgi:hypothetical protein
MTVRIEDEDPFPDDAPPPLEFDQDGQYALASPGLTNEDREDIRQEARALAAAGLAREALGNWICRKVARTVGGRSGFDAIDGDGNAIDLPEVAAARSKIKREIGSHRQDKRNTDIATWRERCAVEVAKGGDRRDLEERCIRAALRAAEGYSVELAFQGLPPIYGRDGRSVPNGRTLRKKMFP